jgi:hypothetical protein
LKPWATFSAVSGEQRVDEAPADRRVINFRHSREGFPGLDLDEGRSRHALHPAGDDQLRIARPDGAGRHPNRIQPRAAQAVDGIS